MIKLKAKIFVCQSLNDIKSNNRYFEVILTNKLIYT